MSKLDDILSDTYYDGVSDHHAPTGVSLERKKEIKELILEVFDDAFKPDNVATIKERLHFTVENLL